MMFETSGASDVSDMDLGSRQTCIKAMVTNLGVKIDNDFNLDKQMNSVVNFFF